MNTDDNLLGKIQTICKNRGFIFQSGDLYGGLAGVYDYGPMGSLLKNNIKESWIKKFVNDRHDSYLLDSAIISGKDALTASGHVGGFCDPLIDDLVTKKRYRADHLIEEAGLDKPGMTIEDMSKIITDHNILSPDGNKLGEVQQFDLMLSTKLGAREDSSSLAYLRPETAQGIFLNYKNIMDSMHPKLPFGIAQIGKAYRNEITPRNYIFRLREFEQMEYEFFIDPSDWEKYFEYWKDEVQEWLKEIGLDMNKLHTVEMEGNDKAHYSKRTIDFEFEYPFGQKELYGLAYRGTYDLDKHAQHSKTKLQYTDPFTNKTYVPAVIEPSVGLERLLLAILISSYREDEIEGSHRSYLALPIELTPLKITVSPLVKNKEEIVEKAKHVFGLLKATFGSVNYDDNGNVGKRYRRADEVGVPYCIVVDYESLEDGTVSIRDRDTTNQVRLPIELLVNHFGGIFDSNK